MAEITEPLDLATPIPAKTPATRPAAELTNYALKTMAVSVADHDANKITIGGHATLTDGTVLSADPLHKIRIDIPDLLAKYGAHPVGGPAAVMALQGIKTIMALELSERAKLAD